MNAEVGHQIRFILQRQQPLTDLRLTTDLQAFSQVRDQKSGAEQMQFTIAGVPGQCEAMCIELRTIPSVSVCRVLDVETNTVQE